MGNLERWDRMSRPPPEALKTIQAGRLKGKSDINPQWRYKVMTDVFGPCGIGWAWSVKRLWTEPAHDGQLFAFAEVELRVMEEGHWSEPIPGIGGHFLVIKESAGLHANDEAYKMATTDALGTAMKMLGVAADVYAGLWDGSKYKEPGSRWEGQFEPHGGQPSQPSPASRQVHECPKCGGPVEFNAKATKENRWPLWKCQAKDCTGGKEGKPWASWAEKPFQAQQSPAESTPAPTAAAQGTPDGDALLGLVTRAGGAGITATQLGQYTVKVMGLPLAEITGGALIALNKKLASGEIKKWLAAQDDVPY